MVAAPSRNQKSGRRLDKEQSGTGEKGTHPPYSNRYAAFGNGFSPR